MTEEEQTQHAELDFATSIPRTGGGGFQVRTVLLLELRYPGPVVHNQDVTEYEYMMMLGLPGETL